MNSSILCSLIYLVWRKEKNINNTFSFITLCPWDAVSHKIVSLASHYICVQCTYCRAHYVWWLEIELNTDCASERGAENKEAVVIYGDKKGVGKAWPRREGSQEPALHARGLLWEKELTGRRSAASSSQTTAAQKEETSWGCCDTSRSSSVSLFTCLPLPLTQLIYARHRRNTQSLSDTEHVHWRFIRKWQAACARKQTRRSWTSAGIWGGCSWGLIVSSSVMTLMAEIETHKPLY